ncbi:MAG: hypothetical protein ABIT08_15655 [Bacteroidia bacterium]
MKAITAVTYLILLLCGFQYQLNAQNQTVFAGGFTFQSPDGWVKTGDDGYYEFTREGVKVSINIGVHFYESPQAMAANVGNTNDVQNNTYLKGTCSAYGDNGLYVHHEGTLNGVQADMQSINLFSPHGVGITIAANCYSGIGCTSYFEIVKKIAASVQFHQPRASQYAQQWINRIGGKQLVWYDNEGGSFEKRTYDLCTNGYFIRAYSGGYNSFGGNGDLTSAHASDSEGHYAIYSLNKEGILYLKYNDGDVVMKTLKSIPNENSFYLDDTKYFPQRLENCR